MCSNLEEDDKKVPSTPLWWIFSIIICFLIWVLGGLATNWFAVNYFEVGDNDNAPALFGDSFGAVNALISAIAFAGMLVTFRLQKYELSLQREELSAQRKEFNQQNATLKLQRFENTFFNMLELQQQIVDGLTLEYKASSLFRSGNIPNPPEDEFYKGRETFQGVLCSTRIHQGVYKLIEENGVEKYSDSQTISMFDHYFRHLYTILKFIDETKVFDERSLREEGESIHEAKYRYATILRATLSRYELVLLYYNGLSINGRDKLKPLLERYCMLNNLNKDLLRLSKNSIKELHIPDDTKNIIQVLQEKEYSGTDYEILLTNDTEDQSKYHYSAFGHTAQEEAIFESLLANREHVTQELLKSLKPMTEEEKKYKKVWGKV